MHHREEKEGWKIMVAFGTMVVLGCCRGYKTFYLWDEVVAAEEEDEGEDDAQQKKQETRNKKRGRRKKKLQKQKKELEDWGGQW